MTEAGAVVERYGVTIDGTKNIPGTMPTSSTAMFSKNVLHFVNNLVQDGKFVFDVADQIIKDTLVTKGGEIVHAGALEAMIQRGET